MHKVLVSILSTKTLSAEEIANLIRKDVVSTDTWKCSAIHITASRDSCSIVLETENIFQSITLLAKDITDTGDFHNILFNFKMQPVPPDSSYDMILSVYDFYTDLDHAIDSSSLAHQKKVTGSGHALTDAELDARDQLEFEQEEHLERLGFVIVDTDSE